MGSEDRTITALLGIAAVLVSAVGILGAVALAPWFSVVDHALSDLGRAGRSSAGLFNGTLILSGLLGIGFIAGIWRRSATSMRRIGLSWFGIAATFVVLIGFFPSPHPYHYPVAVGFYLTLTFGLFLFGTGEVLAGKSEAGLVTIWLGIVHAGSWMLWWFVWGERGIVGPELVGATIFSAWVCGMVWRKTQTGIIGRIMTN